MRLKVKTKNRDSTYVRLLPHYKLVNSQNCELAYNIKLKISFTH